jgi:hypothetical protein
MTTYRIEAESEDKSKIKNNLNLKELKLKKEGYVDFLIIRTDKSLNECLSTTRSSDALFHIYYVNKEHTNWNEENKFRLIRFIHTSDHITEVMNELIDTLKSLQQLLGSIDNIHLLSRQKQIHNVRYLMRRIVSSDNDDDQNGTTIKYMSDTEPRWQKWFDQDTTGTAIVHVNYYEKQTSINIQENDYYIWIVQNPESLIGAHATFKNYREYPRQTIVYYANDIKDKTNMNACLDDGIDSLNYLEQCVYFSSQEEAVPLSSSLQQLSDSTNQLNLNNLTTLSKFLIANGQK